MNSTKNSMMINILNRYYKNQKELKNTLKYNKNTKIKFDLDEKDVKNNVMTFINDNKVIKKANYELLGYYILETKQWNWSWSMTDNTKSDTTIAHEVLKYGLSIKGDDNINEILKEIIEVIRVSNFVITNKTAYDIFISYISYISKTKAKNIFNYIKNDIIEVYVLNFIE